MAITFTIGGDAGTTNTVYTATISPTGNTATGDWTEFGSRTGPGTVTGTLAAGVYIVIVESSLAGVVSYSDPLRVAVWSVGETMTPEEAVGYILESSAGLGSIAGDKIFPNMPPENIKKPYVVYTRRGGRHEHSLTAAAGWARASFDVRIVADSYATAKAGSDAIRQALDGYRGTVSNDDGSLEIGGVTLEDDSDIMEKPTGGGDRPTSMVILDFTVWYVESIPTF